MSFSNVKPSFEMVVQLMKPQTINIMRTLILSLAALFIFTLSYAQGSAKSKSILDNANQEYEKSEGIKLIFTINTEDSYGSAYEPQAGTAMVKGNKFKLDLPYATTWFDGKTQWVLLKNANEVNISNPSAEELATISPLALLNMYKTGYVLKDPRSRTIKGIEVFEVGMTPTNKSHELKTISIAINKKTNAIVEIEFTTNNGISNRIAVSEFNLNDRYSNDLFSFNKLNHPGVEVIDLR